MAFKVLRLMYSDGWLFRAFIAFRVLRLMYSDGWLFRAFMAFRVLRLMYSDGWLYRCTSQILRGCQGRRTSYVPPSLPPPLIFKAKFETFVTLPS